jgi:hypothetical protein
LISSKIETFLHFVTLELYIINCYRIWALEQYTKEKPDLGDEFHYLLKCSFMSDMRKNCINNNFFRNANILKFGELMNQTKLSKLKKLCVFIRFINNNVCPPGAMLMKVS